MLNPVRPIRHRLFVGDWVLKGFSIHPFWKPKLSFRFCVWTSFCFLWFYSMSTIFLFQLESTVCSNFLTLILILLSSCSRFSVPSLLLTTISPPTLSIFLSFVIKITTKSFRPDYKIPFAMNMSWEGIGGTDCVRLSYVLIKKKQNYWQMS